MTTTIYTQFNVTEAQVSAAHRICDLAAHIIFYIVESATTPGVEYKVVYNRSLKALQCLPFTGEPCKASVNGQGCWHKRAACAAAAEFKAERDVEEAIAMAELQAEIDAECCTSGAYTAVTDETSSSLDGVKFEVAPSGRLVPMR